MDARTLLRAAYEVHLEQGGARGFPAGTALDMSAAAAKAGVIPGTPPYDTAVDRLEREETIEPNPITASTVGGTHYLVTERGRRMLGLD